MPARTREREARGDESQDGASQGTGVDLHAGEKEHERETEHRDDLDRRVDVHDREHRRTNDDPGDDLENHRRQQQAPSQTEEERDAEADRGDDEQAIEPGHV